MVHFESNITGHLSRLTLAFFRFRNPWPRHCLRLHHIDSLHSNPKGHPRRSYLRDTHQRRPEALAS